MIKVFLYQKDYTNKGADRYYLWTKAGGSEVSANEIVSEEGLLLCHDYWLIAHSLYSSTGKLPGKVLDVEDFKLAIGGVKVERKEREQKKVAAFIADFYENTTRLSEYVDIYNRKLSFDSAVYDDIAPCIYEQWSKLQESAGKVGELERYLEVELPVFNFLVLSSVKGINIDRDILKKHKLTIEHDYYTALKKFAADYKLPIEVPDDQDVCEYLEPKGYDFSGVSLDYVLEFVPMSDSFADDLIFLRRLANSRNVLSAIPMSRTSISPVVDIFGSITSRIYYRDPALQNLSKRHRDIIVPDGPEFELSYVDYDQFEVGIMAALSGDPVLKELYETQDLYSVVSTKIFGDGSMRKFSKRLFLSYAYGMKLKGLVDAAASHGSERGSVKEFFNQFSVFEAWKETISTEYQSTGRIGTVMGNFLIRENGEKLTEKERRSCVSQVVQGTASLIFKKALLRLCDDNRLNVKIPMHDAVLVQHPLDYDKTKLVHIFCEVMTEHLGGVVTGRASLESYCPG